MKNILKLVAASFMGGAVLFGCGGTDSDVADNELQQEAKVNSSNARVPIDRNPSAPYVHQEDTTEMLSTRNIGGTAMVPSNTVIQNASSNPELSTFMGAVKQAGMVNTLNGTGPYTLFAPSNEAFEALPEGTVEDLLKAENKQRLVEFVNNHIVAGKLNAKSLQSGSTIKTAGNGQLKASNRGADVMVNGAHVETADIVSSNGVIHVVDKVLMPEQQ